jgi:signal transduction histidine kinase
MSFSLRMNPDAPKTVALLRGKRAGGTAERGIRLAALRVPLATKLFGANLLVVAVLLAGWFAAGERVSWAVLGLVAIVVAVHLVLVMVALRPIRDLENAASRVWHGDYGARVERSAVADNEVLRVGSMFNILLDSLATDRARMRALAAEVIAAGDRERAEIARELQDSTAQHVAALLFELSTATRDATDPTLAERLREARDAAEAILEEVRLLSQTVHPAVLDDLGLEAALRKLARDSSHGNGIDIDVKVDVSERLPINTEAVLYRVAQEAVRNATRHGAPGKIRMTLARYARSATLEVHDDGRGFDLDAAERTHPQHGLASMRERVSLVDGWLEIKTARGGGTTITATIPLAPSPDAVH